MTYTNNYHNKSRVPTNVHRQQVEKATRLAHETNKLADKIVETISTAAGQTFGALGGMGAMAAVRMATKAGKEVYERIQQKKAEDVFKTNALATALKTKTPEELAEGAAKVIKEVKEESAELENIDIAHFNDLNETERQKTLAQYKKNYGLGALPKDIKGLVEEKNSFAKLAKDKEGWATDIRESFSGTDIKNAANEDGQKVYLAFKELERADKAIKAYQEEHPDRSDLLGQLQEELWASGIPEERHAAVMQDLNESIKMAKAYKNADKGIKTAYLNTINNQDSQITNYEEAKAAAIKSFVKKGSFEEADVERNFVVLDSTLGLSKQFQKKHTQLALQQWVNKGAQDINDQQHQTSFTTMIKGLKNAEGRPARLDLYANLRDEVYKAEGEAS